MLWTREATKAHIKTRAALMLWTLMLWRASSRRVYATPRSPMRSSHNKSHMVLNGQSGALEGISQMPYPNVRRYHGMLCCKSQSTLGLFDG